MSDRERRADAVADQVDDLLDRYALRFVVVMSAVTSGACLVAWAWGAGLL